MTLHGEVNAVVTPITDPFFFLLIVWSFAAPIIDGVRISRKFCYWFKASTETKDIHYNCKDFLLITLDFNCLVILARVMRCTWLGRVYSKSSSSVQSCIDQ